MHHGKLLIQLNTSLPRVADDASPGEKLWYYRELRGFTREKFGRLVGLEPGGVQNFEAGINQIHYRHALSFAELLGVEPEIFLSDYTRFCAPGYGDRIRIIRYACDQTQEEFAETLGVTRNRVSVWEAEIDEFHPSFQSFEKLAAIASEKGIQIKQLIEEPDSYSDGYDEFISVEYGKKIKYIRAAYGVTQSEFCRMLGYEGDTSACMWESENRKPLRKHFGRIKFLAEAKGISLARLNEDPDFYRDTYSKFIERDSGKKIRYIRLTYLIPPLLQLMDEGKMALSVGVELSYLDENLQWHIAEIAKRDEVTPSYSQAVRLRRESSDGLFILSESFIDSVLSEPKPNQREQIRLRRDDFREVFPDHYTDEDIKKDIAAGLELLHRKRIRDREER